MSSTTLPIVQRVPLPSGSASYEAARDDILQKFAASVPDDLRLPVATIEAPPTNVTSIPSECGLLSALDLEITENHDAYALAQAIAAGQYTAVAVATAFAKRAIIAHQLTACLTEWFMAEAVEQAAALDAHLAATGTPVGPLHGVPVSIKAHIPIAGHWSNVGYLRTLTQDQADCQMVAILRRAGAVFYCKTNQPQAIMHLESTSLYGRVLNPHNINLSAGGSSGGEAALIALRGSVLGVGTDIGGSIRGPAAFCGIYGFKPTSYVLPMKGFLPGGFAAELNILCSTGPMCTSLRDVDLFMAVMAAAKPYLEDPRVLPIPWTGAAGAAVPPSSSAPLKIGFMMHDGAIMPQPPVTRALEWARSLLEQTSGIQVKSFAPFQAAQAVKNIRRAYWPDGGKHARELLAEAGEPVLPLTEWVLADASQHPALDATGVLQQRLDRDEFRCNFSQHWQAQDVDLFICPSFVGPACAHETAWYWNYTAFFNYVDYPGVVVPTPVKALAKGAEDCVSGEPLGEECKKVRQLWREGDFEGAPINLQVVARRYHDNELISGLVALQAALKLP